MSEYLKSVDHFALEEEVRAGKRNARLASRVLESIYYLTGIRQATTFFSPFEAQEWFDIVQEGTNPGDNLNILEQEAIKSGVIDAIKLGLSDHVTDRDLSKILRYRKAVREGKDVSPPFVRPEHRLTTL